MMAVPPFLFSGEGRGNAGQNKLVLFQTLPHFLVVAKQLPGNKYELGTSSKLMH